MNKRKAKKLTAMGRNSKKLGRRGRAPTTGNQAEKQSSSDKAAKKVVSRKTDRGTAFESCNSAEQSSKKKTTHPRRTHSKETVYKCEQCDKTFTRKSTLTEHQRVHSGEKPYECDKCDKTFTRKFILNQHKRIHSEEKPYKCSLCKKGFTQKGNLDRHRYLKHLKMHGEESKSQHFQSGKASAKNVNFTDFTTHIKVPPGKGVTLTCVTRVLIHRGKLFGHQQINIAKKSKTSLPNIKYKDEKPDKCDQCDKCFIVKRDLILHEKTHIEEKPYLCNKCDEAFAQKEDLNWHFRAKHSKNQLFRKQFPVKYRITHSADKVYQCGVCNKKFTNKIVLKLHRRKHIGEKPFQCSKCGKVFKLYGNLKIHLGTRK